MSPNLPSHSRVENMRPELRPNSLVLCVEHTLSATRVGESSETLITTVCTTRLLWYNIYMRGYGCFGNVLFIVFLSVTFISAHASFAASGYVPTPAEAKDVPSTAQIFRLINRQRIDRNLPVVRFDDRLSAVAQERANDMARRSYYAHRTPDGTYFDTLLDQQRMAPSFACENLDMEFTKQSEAYVRSWMLSTDGHRECMLSPEAALAGYGVAKTQAVSYQGAETPSYIVVAIHASSN